MVHRFLVPILSVCLVATPALAEMVDRHFHESFPADESTRLELVHGDGDVEISVWDRDVVDVDVRYRAEIKQAGVGTEPEFEVEFSRVGDTIRVRGKERTSVTFGFLYIDVREFVYTVKAPAHVALSLRGQDGNVTVEDWRAEIECHLTDGDVRLERIQSPRTRVAVEDGRLEGIDLEGELVIDAQDGDVTLTDCAVTTASLKTADGDLTLRGCGGDFAIESQDGRVRLHEHRSGLLRVESDDGDVGLDLVDSDEIDLEVYTRDGNVRIRIEPGISTLFDLATRDGRVSLDVPDASFRDRHPAGSFGEIGGGKGLIRVRTVDGDVDLVQSG